MEVVELPESSADVHGVLGRDDLRSALWCPCAALPTGDCVRALTDDGGIGEWAVRGVDSGPLSAYTFGPVAFRAFAACVDGCSSFVHVSVAETVAHLVREHGVPFEGSRPGLVALADGELRARVLLGGKDVSLRRLAPVLAGVRVDSGLTVTWPAWRADRAAELREVRRVCGAAPLIVRSCAAAEDSWEHSAAGEFESVPVAEGGDDRLAEAIDVVFASYPGECEDNRVLVQRFLQPVDAAAVVTTRTLTGAPYYTAVVDESSGRTDTVTAGTGDPVDTWFVYRDGVSGVLARPDAWGLSGSAARILGAAAQVEAAAGTSHLDTEFAISAGDVHLLQARPLAAGRGQAGDDADVAGVLGVAGRALVGLKSCDGRLLGADPVLSCMADWNPAEMLGRRPRPLAVSVYEHFITDLTWARQRHSYGYRDLRGVPLMHTVAGHPYIDVRASLASFLPAGLGEDRARELLQAQIALLRSDPDAHDKIEFEIAVTCWTPDVVRRTAALAKAGVSQTTLSELREQLLGLTRTGIVRLPADRHELVQVGSPTDADTRPGRLAGTLATAQRAALIFAHLARAGFIAVDLLRSLREAGLADRYDEWMRGLGTVTTRMQRDAEDTAAGRMEWAAFVRRYRWVRPGTYDLTVPAYGQDAEGYLRPLLDQPHEWQAHAGAPWSPHLADKVEAALKPLRISAEDAESFFRKAITGRENGKAVYAAWVSAALEAVAALGESAGLDREDVTYLRVGELLGGHSRTWSEIVARSRADEAVESRVELPDVITGPGDLRCFKRGPGRTNFIGTARAEGPVHADPVPDSPPPPGSVIVIEAADPGYDWVFAHRPGALVTAYGGANSHMAIRCAELGIPAAIGVGPQVYEACATAGRLVVDCAARRLEVIR
ncbi:hypothetical protein J7F01_08950 [Streptomyces sp. ISL-22]|uniref:PEP-utilizing enzyme n=1 Tax=unclassified Streptomyces TaxID=2593676 RepID=UPI001BE6348C|nr:MULTISPECIES: PEP-utilizing enzyme [unclassified Streptomyces]MBT2417995.1 hypothetical protein [Streptomyces sp. ISL-24]MBT2432330.1 hypothetical protein [Streptomyces sp. ISL-22]